MLLLGLLLLAATGAFTGLVIADNLSGGPDYQVTVLGNTIATMSSLEIFLSGLALALIFCLGLAMTGTGGLLARRRRVRIRHARRHAVTAESTGAETVTERETLVPERETIEEPSTPAGQSAAQASSAATATARTHRHIFGH